MCFEFTLSFLLVGERCDKIVKGGGDMVRDAKFLHFNGWMMQLFFFWLI